MHTTVDPAAGVPLTCVRKVAGNGADRLKNSFQTVGFWAGSDNTVVINMTGLIERDMNWYFKSIGVAEDELAEQKKSRHVWHKTADEEHT